MTSSEAAARLDELAATPPEDLDPRFVADARTLLALLPAGAIDRSAVFGINLSARYPCRVVFYWARSRYGLGPGNRITTIENLAPGLFEVYTDLLESAGWPRLPRFPSQKCLDLAGPETSELLVRLVANQLGDSTG